MKRKPKKIVGTKVEWGKYCYNLVIVLFSLVVFIWGTYLYCTFFVDDIIQENAKSNDTEKQLQFLNDFHDLVEIGAAAAIYANGNVPDLIRLLHSTNKTVQEEATRTLLFLTKNSEKFPLLLANEGTIPPLLELIHSSNENIVEMALMSLQHSVHQNPVLGTKILLMGLDKHLVTLINTEPSKEILNAAISIIFDLYRSKRHPSILHQSAAVFLPVFRKLLRHSDNETVKTSAVALYAITENSSNKKPLLVFDNKMIKILIHLLRRKNKETSNAALLVLAHIVNNANVQNKLILDDQILKLLPNLLNHSRENFVIFGLNFIQKSLHTFPNQTSVIVRDSLVPLITDKLTHQTSNIQTQAAAVLSAFANYGKKGEIRTLATMQIIHNLYNILIKTNYDENKRMILHTIGVLIQHANLKEKYNIYDDFGKLDAFKEFSKLLEHKQRLIRKWTQLILDSFSSENVGTYVCEKKSIFV